MAVKQKGTCPFCGEAAEVIKKNSMRRDSCKCPSCQETIYVCRTPGCHQYAKGTLSYDHELCPSCTSKASNAGKWIIDVGKAVGIPVLVTILGRKLNSKEFTNSKSK